MEGKVNSKTLVDILRVHRDINWGTDNHWNVEPYAWINDKPMTNEDAMRTIARIAEGKKYPGWVMVRTYNQGVKMFPEIAEIRDYAEVKGVRVVINWITGTIDVYCCVVC